MFVSQSFKLYIKFSIIANILVIIINVLVAFQLGSILKIAISKVKFEDYREAGVLKIIALNSKELFYITCILYILGIVVQILVILHLFYFYLHTRRLKQNIYAHTYGSLISVLLFLLAAIGMSFCGHIKTLSGYNTEKEIWSNRTFHVHLFTYIIPAIFCFADLFIREVAFAALIREYWRYLRMLHERKKYEKVVKYISEDDIKKNLFITYNQLGDEYRF